MSSIPEVQTDSLRSAISEQPWIPTRCDVVVIGGGIGGLSCANYLAKAGMKVALIEKHYMSGGCCSSFRRGPYYFDAGAHYLSSCRPDGQIGKLMYDLNLDLELIHCDPSDTILARDHKIEMRPGSAEVMSEGFINAFPHEAKMIRAFWRYVGNTDSRKLYAELRFLTFQDLLDQFFCDVGLKRVLSIPLGNIGLPAWKASALTAAFLYREYLLDGGYYPKGGMQRFPDALVARFRSYGGTICPLTKAEKITIDSAGKPKHVVVKVRGRYLEEIGTRFVVANCDPFQLRLLLDGQGNCGDTSFLPDELKAQLPSISCFMVHLGVRMDLAKSGIKTNVWYYPWEDVNDYYQGLLDGKVEFGRNHFVICSLPSLHDASLLPEGMHSVHAIIGAPFKSREFWEHHKDNLADDVIDRLEQFLPRLSQYIEVKQVATPLTMVKYTANYQGAMYGWAALPQAVGRSRFPEELGIENLYLTGHWTGLPTGYSGIPTVAASGRRVAGKILSCARKQAMSPSWTSALLR